MWDAGNIEVACNCMEHLPDAWNCGRTSICETHASIASATVYASLGVCAGIKWALVLLVTLNLLQLNLLYFSSRGVSRCTARGPAGIKAQRGLAAVSAMSNPRLLGSPMGSPDHLGMHTVSRRPQSVTLQLSRPSEQHLQNLLTLKCSAVLYVFVYPASMPCNI